MRALVSKYFVAIESALGLAHGTLWDAPVGRAFAGYAPVLVTLGRIIAYTTNPLRVTNRLNATHHEAWDVIYDVLAELLDREQAKFHQNLSKTLPQLPSTAYDAKEQLTYLTQMIHGLEIQFSRRFHFPDANDLPPYMENVRLSLDDHPFVKHGKMANDVLGSAIVAHAIVHDMLSNTSHDILRRVCRQPFLWRTMRKSLSSEARAHPDGQEVIISGDYFGYLCCSYWIDSGAAG